MMYALILHIPHKEANGERVGRLVAIAESVDLCIDIAESTFDIPHDRWGEDDHGWNYSHMAGFYVRYDEHALATIEPRELNVALVPPWWNEIKEKMR